MEKQLLICTQCPNSCILHVDAFRKKVEGNSCKRGEECAIEELVFPRRVVTTTVKVFADK